MLRFLNFPKGISVIYGPAASGKTTLCLQVTAATNRKTVYIDTENSFSVERIQKMNPDINLENIIVIHARRYSEQFAAVKKLADVKSMSLVIVDSFTKYYRRKVQEKVTIRPPTIRMLTMLKEMKAPVIITAQVYSDMQGNTYPVGKDLLKRFAAQTIKLENTNQKRTATILETGMEIPFIITEQGVRA